MINKKEITNEEILIQKYYNLSKLTNRYITIVVSLILSILIFSLNTSSSNNFHNINIASNNILTKNTNINIGLDNTNFNKLSKNIKANLIITKSYVKNNKNYLGIGTFMNKKETLYLPINTIFDNKLINTKTYLISIKNGIKNNLPLKIKPLKTKIQLNTGNLIKKYNLSCINTVFNNSIFCNINKKIVINKLIKERNFELSKKSYNYLFKNLSYKPKTKCNIIKKIFNLKYNFKNIKDIAQKYCENTDNIGYTNMEKIIDIYNTILGKNLFNDKISEYQDIALIKLAQQQFNLIHSQDTISYTKILYHLNLIKSLINNSYINEDTAIVTKKILEEIKEKSKYSDNYDNITKKIKFIEVGNQSIGENGLNDYINTKENKVNSNNKKILLIKNKIHSQKELISNLFDSTYKDIFSYTKITYNKDSKISYIKGYLTLSFHKKSGVGIIKKTLPISFNLINLVGNKFQINNIKIEDTKINEYINYIGYNINKENTLIGLKQYLETILYNPLVLNDYGKKNKPTICDKVKNYIKGSASCSNGTITLNIKDKNIEGGLTLIIKINNSLLIKSIKLNKEQINYKNKGALIKEILKLDITSITKRLQKTIGNKIKNSTLSKIKSFIKKDINNIKEQKITKMIGMSDSNIITLNQKFKDKLGTQIKLIRHIKGDYYKIYFNLGGYTFVGIYEFNKNKILHLGLLVKGQSNDYKLFLFKNADIILSNNNIEKINQIKFETKKLLKEIDSKKFQEYQDYLKKHKNN